MKCVNSLILVASALTITIGCGQSQSGPSAGSASAYRLATEPAGATEVIAARDTAKDNEKLTIVGRIGGDAKPWIDGTAAFTVVDLSIKPCDEKEGCETPWDYCCELDAVAKSKAMVKIVDAAGNIVPTDARELLGVKELNTVVVQGMAKRDEAGNLTILANGVFVRP